jgi:hypothetical protein
MGVGRRAEGVSVVSDTECWLCLSQVGVNILEGKYREGQNIE